MSRLPAKQYKELLDTLERVKQEAVEPTPGVALKRRRQARFPAILQKSRKFNLLAPSFFARMEKLLKEAGCSVVVSRKTKTDGRLVIFNDGSKAPIGENRPVIVDVNDDKMTLSRQGEAGQVEFVKGPEASGRWIAGRDWVIANAHRLLIGGQVQGGAAAAETPTVPTEPLQVQPMVKEETVEEMNVDVEAVENIPPPAVMAQQQVEHVSPPAEIVPPVNVAQGPSGEPMIPIRVVLRELATWSKTFSSFAALGGTPNPPVTRPGTPPLANLSPWLLREHRTVLETIAASYKLAFWENSLGEFCYQKEADALQPSTSSGQVVPPHVIFSDVYMPSYVTAVTGNYRIPIGSPFIKAEHGGDLGVWGWMVSVLKSHFGI